ncbi:ATP-dependent DNA helicase Q-like SIM [Platanthera zijinensis]|uniref:ATP-dependent DNA helicase Q-like SIM n=1 Tax=Platanthera zijinensis TaxID=2320716 RepID=A0AAP0BA08_9ASPA
MVAISGQPTQGNSRKGSREQMHKKSNRRKQRQGFLDRRLQRRFLAAPGAAHNTLATLAALTRRQRTPISPDSQATPSSSTQKLKLSSIGDGGNCPAPIRCGGTSYPRLPRVKPPSERPNPPTNQRFDVYETDKKHIMELLRETFRDYKAKFKSLYYRPSETPASVIARGGPKNMPANQFADMVTYWYSSKGKVALDKAIEEQMSQCPPDTPLTDIHEAAFRSTFGEEYYGRCRGMGMGVTAIQVYPELSRRSQTTRKGQQKSNDSEEIAILKSQVATMQTTMDFLVDAISRQGSRNDRSGTSGAPGIHLYPDQFLKMMSLIRGQNSNNVTTSNDTPQTNHATRANCEEGSGQPDITVEQKAMNGVYSIVYVCPETVLRLIEPLKRLAENNGIALFAIDEVHCVSKWGHDFRPDYRRLSVLRENFSAAPIRSNVVVERELHTPISDQSCIHLEFEITNTWLGPGLSPVTGLCPARPGPGTGPGLGPILGPGRAPWPGLGPNQAWPGTGPTGLFTGPGQAGPYTDFFHFLLVAVAQPSLVVAAAGIYKQSDADIIPDKDSHLIDNPTIGDVISLKDVFTFVVWRSTEFAYVLPKYFKHNNFSILVR